jgi:hypothetical protein
MINIDNPGKTYVGKSKDGYQKSPERSLIRSIHVFLSDNFKKGLRLLMLCFNLESIIPQRMGKFLNLRMSKLQQNIIFLIRVIG